jgi:hypothetical protein
MTLSSTIAIAVLSSGAANWRQLAVWLVWSIASCGDHAGGAGQCAPVEPCGGDVVGRWAIESICVSQAELGRIFESDLPAECNGAFVHSEVSVDGAILEYSADGVLTTAGAARLHSQFRFSEGCLAALSTDFPALSERSCASIAEGAAGALELQDRGEGDVTCGLSGDACACDADEEVSSASSVDYVLTKDRVQIGPNQMPYCVSGDTLRYAIPGLGSAVARRW